ncbi:MAG: prepilin peptidase [Patescibacteria group bacterium]|nr:MAG: prepilin peptidase [Patescibacteria group bacterium]
MTAFLVVLLGLAIGSFLNVVIGRLRSGETGWRSRSHCPECRTILRPSELVPLVSFLLLRGKCRSCKKPISWQYPAVEFSTAALFLLAYVLRAPLLGPDGSGTLLVLLRDWFFISVLTVVFVVDLRDMVVFDSVTLPAAAIAFLANVALGAKPLSLLGAAAIGGGFFLLQYAISRGRWIGGGDIRIGAMMGMMLGFPHVLLALFAAYIGGALVALSLLAAGKAKWSGQMAFGTFLSAATVLALFFGQPVVNAYASLLGY